MPFVKALIPDDGGGNDSVVFFCNNSFKLLYKEQTRMNDRMHKMKMGLVLVECLFFVLFFEDEAINGSEVGILPNGQRRVRQGPTLNIEVQLKPTTIVFVLEKEYGGKGVGWLGNRRETILGMDGFFGEKVTA